MSQKKIYRQPIETIFFYYCLSYTMPVYPAIKKIKEIKIVYPRLSTSRWLIKVIALLVAFISVFIFFFKILFF